MANCLYSGDKPLGIVQSNAEDVAYDSNTSVKEKIDDIADYSETEKVIGKWIDGKPLYQKTISFGGLPNATTKSVAHNISNLKKIVNFNGYATDNSNFIPIPYIYQSSGNMVGIQIYANATNVVIRTMLNDSGFTECYITLKYTKTTD